MGIIIDSRLEDCQSVPEVTENFNRVLGITDEMQNIIDDLCADVEINVTFDSDGGSSVAEQVIAYKSKATKPADPTKAGNRFNQWYKGTVLYDFDTLCRRDFQLTAHWLPTFTVTYANGGGTGTLPTQDPCIEGETFTVASGEGLSYEGHVFAGWTDGTETYQAGDIYTVQDENVTLTAVWTEEE